MSLYLLQEIEATAHKITATDLDKLQAFIDEATDKGTHYSGMTYEEGMTALLDYFSGNTTIDELVDS